VESFIVSRTRLFVTALIFHEAWVLKIKRIVLSTNSREFAPKIYSIRADTRKFADSLPNLRRRYYPLPSLWIQSVNGCYLVLFDQLQPADQGIQSFAGRRDVMKDNQQDAGIRPFFLQQLKLRDAIPGAV
jgi:hypothetical protein